MEILTTDEILAKCERCRERFHALTGWAECAAPSLNAALLLWDRIDDEPEKTLAAIKAQASLQGRKRQLSTKKLDLVCVYECCPATTKEERKECSRFSNVVRAARLEGVSPDRAHEWLKTKTLTELLRQTRASKPITTFAVKLPLDAFPLLAEALREGAKQPESQELVAILQDAARKCEALLRGFKRPLDHNSAAPNDHHAS